MRCMHEVQGQEPCPEKAEEVREEDLFEYRVRQRRRTLVQLAVDVITSSRIRSRITMRRAKDALLANREVSICIDSNMLRGCLTLSLAPVRMSPTVPVLTSIVEQFAREEVLPVVQAYLKSPKEDILLYVPGSGVPRTVLRLVQIAVEVPLMEEMERFKLVPNSQPQAVPAEKIEVSIHTSPSVITPVFVPVQSNEFNHARDSRSVTGDQPAKESRPRLPIVAQQVRIFSSYIVCGMDGTCA
jgi:hypothetical protein